MKKLFLSLFILTSMSVMAENPFYNEFNGTPFDTPPFDSFENSQYEEAIDRGIAKSLQEIDAICNQRSMPDFENTIVALERQGEDLNRVLGIFYNLLEADSDE